MKLYKLTKIDAIHFIYLLGMISISWIWLVEDHAFILGMIIVNLIASITHSYLVIGTVHIIQLLANATFVTNKEVRYYISVICFIMCGLISLYYYVFRRISKYAREKLREQRRYGVRVYIWRIPIYECRITNLTANRKLYLFTKGYKSGFYICRII